MGLDFTRGYPIAWHPPERRWRCGSWTSSAGRSRHTAATLLIAQGVHIRVVQEVLGHTRVTTTERYTHVATLQMKDASERMDQALWGPG
jgi:integrase